MTKFNTRLSFYHRKYILLQYISVPRTCESFFNWYRKKLEGRLVPKHICQWCNKLYTKRIVHERSARCVLMRMNKFVKTNEDDSSMFTELAATNALLQLSKSIIE